MSDKKNDTNLLVSSSTTGFALTIALTASLHVIINKEELMESDVKNITS